MNTYAAFLFALACLTFARSPAEAQDDWPYQNPISVTCSGDFLNCANVLPGGSGPSEGYGDFTSAGYQVIFDAETGNPLTWYQFSGEYDATFGYGGTFTLQGPDGTFNGVITSGSVHEDDSLEEAEITFTFDGHWSDDGKYYAGSGDAYYRYGDVEQPYAGADVTMSTTPEPGSLYLMLSGVLGIGFAKRNRAKEPITNC